MNGEHKSNAENPTTAIEAERSEGGHSEAMVPSRRKSTHSAKRRKHKHHHGHGPPDFSTIPGVFKIPLSELTQKIVGCVAGEHVTVEKLWTYVDKELIMDNLELHSESSEFLPLLPKILEYQRPKVLFGYVPDESTDYDEFYVCATERATDTVLMIVEKMRKRQEERLRDAVAKTPFEWTSFGSEKEIEEIAPKNNRSLIEVEIESKYPILPFRIRFRPTLSQDVRDGYMELRPGDDLQPSIHKRRVDVEIQVSPALKNNEAQTTCSYPANAYTQYEYNFDLSEKQEATEECMKIMQQYIRENEEEFFDLLLVNGSINLYSNDYQELVLNPVYTLKIILQNPKKYLTFLNMELCQSKIISCVAWHPFLTGLVVAAYVDRARCVYMTRPPTGDSVLRAIHGSNPVLLWCFKDDLNPRLILETPREVFTIYFCPFNGNLVVGGLSNGQIILWDITNKLEQVEEEEILTSDQQKYRAHMFYLMNWMKNIHNAAKIRPTVLSDPKYSHAACVTSVGWMPPTHRILKTGKIQKCAENKPSLQFMTSGEDGVVLVWDLLEKPHIMPGGFKPLRKSRRLKRRPSALVASLSPFKMLHLNLRPTYRINVNVPGEVDRPLSVSYFYSRFVRVNYERKDKKKPLPKISERLVYEATSIDTSDPIAPEFVVGTQEGDMMYVKWEGQEFDSGEIVNFENAQFTNHGQYHDGPIVSMGYSDILDMYLTVGGRVFALWRSDFKNRPVFFRKVSCNLTYGKFYYFNRVAIKLLRADGMFERWVVYNKSNGPTNTVLCSDGPTTLISTHLREIKEIAMGLADNRGALRVLTMRPTAPQTNFLMQTRMKEFVQAEIKRRNKFFKWQEQFNRKFREQRDSKDTKTKSLVADAASGERSRTSKDDKDDKKSTRGDAGKKKYFERVKEEHFARELNRIKDIVSNRKQLDIDQLVRERDPLKKLEAENEIKRRKQRIRVRDSEKIFEETVTMLFPDVVKKPPPAAPNPYSTRFDSDNLDYCFETYKNVAINAQDFVEDHPFRYEFNWGNVLNGCHERRKRLDETYTKAPHYDRYPKYKENRDAKQKQAESIAEKMTAHFKTVREDVDDIKESFSGNLHTENEE